MTPLTRFLAPFLLCLPGFTQTAADVAGDLRALSQKGGAAPGLTRRIVALAEGTHKPSELSVRLFAADLERVLQGKHAAEEQVRTLAADIAAVLKSAGTSTMDFYATVRDFETTLAASGVAGPLAHGAANGLEAIGKEVRGPEGAPNGRVPAVTRH